MTATYTVSGPKCDCINCATKPSIAGYGPVDAQVMAIGIAPGRKEIQAGRPFVGPAGDRFNQVLAATGFDRKNVYCTNLIGWFKDAPTPDEISLCWPRLREEIRDRRPRLILALGALASEWLTGYKVGKVRGGILQPWDLPDPSLAHLREVSTAGIRKAGPRGVTGGQLIAVRMAARLQGKPDPVRSFGVLPYTRYAVMPTWHPAATLPGRNPALIGDLIRDFAKIPRFLRGELDRPEIKPRIIRTRAEAQQALYWFSGRELALDVETTFDTPEAWGRLLCLSISTRLAPSRTPRSGTNLPPTQEGERYVSYVFPREVLDDLDWPGSLAARNRGGGGVATRWGFHNGPFDRNVLRRELGVDLPIDWDSMYASYSCDERPGYDRDDKQSTASAGAGRNKPIGPGYHSLDQLAREYLSGGFFKDDTKGWIGSDPDRAIPPGLGIDPALYTPGVPEVDCLVEEFRAKKWQQIYQRNALDAAYTMALPQRLPPNSSAPCYRSLLIPAANAYADVQQYGILIDQEKLRYLEATWTQERDLMARRLEEQAADLGYINPPRLKRDTEGPPFNPASTQQLAALLFDPKYLGIRSRVRTKGGARSTSEEALAEIDHPFVQQLQRLRKYSNTLKYLPIIRAHLRPDGRVHPTALPLITGRYSVVDPPMQTFPQPYGLAAAGVPELGELRSIIIPSPGHRLIATDYEQIEIWVAALLSQDPQMLEDLQAPFEGGRPNYHSRVTREVLKCAEPVGSPRWETVRRAAKVFTFGIEFGEGAKGLAKNANKDSPDLHLTPSQAERIIHDWYARYSVFARWQKGQLGLARKQGYLQNPFGFIRRFPFADDAFKNQIFNAQIQGTASQHGTLAMIELVNPHYLDNTPHSWPPPFAILDHAPTAPTRSQPRSLSSIGGSVLLTIHDEILSEVPESRVDEGIQLVEESMSTPRVPGWPGMKVSSKAGPDWYNMKSMDKLS